MRRHLLERFLIARLLDERANLVENFKVVLVDPLELVSAQEIHIDQVGRDRALFMYRSIRARWDISPPSVSQLEANSLTMVKLSMPRYLTPPN